MLNNAKAIARIKNIAKRDVESNTAAPDDFRIRDYPEIFNDITCNLSDEYLNNVYIDEVEELENEKSN